MSDAPTGERAAPRIRRQALRALKPGARLAYDAPRVAASFPVGDPARAGETGLGSGLAISLRAAREAAGLTVAELAARAGVAKPTVYRIECRATTARPHVVRRLSAALGRAPWTIAEFGPALRVAGLGRPAAPLPVAPVQDSGAAPERPPVDDAGRAGSLASPRACYGLWRVHLRTEASSTHQAARRRAGRRARRRGTRARPRRIRQGGTSALACAAVPARRLSASP